MELLALLCSQIILILWQCWIAARVRRLSVLASRALQRVKAPDRWESRLLELQADVASLSSSLEKALRDVTRLNSRAGMRELRAVGNDKHGPPPPGAPKSVLRDYYRDRIHPKKIADIVIGAKE